MQLQADDTCCLAGMLWGGILPLGYTEAREKPGGQEGPLLGQSTGGVPRAAPLATPTWPHVSAQPVALSFLLLGSLGAQYMGH